MGIKRQRVPSCLSLVKFLHEIHRIAMRSRWLGVLERINWLKQTCCIWSSTRRPANTKRKREITPTFSSSFPSASSGASSVVTPLFRQTKELKPKDGFKKEGMRKQRLALTNGLEQGLNLKSS